MVKTEMFTFCLWFKKEVAEDVKKVFGSYKNFEFHDLSGSKYHDGEIMIYISMFSHLKAMSKQYDEAVMKAKRVGGFISYGQVSRKVVDV